MQLWEHNQIPVIAKDYIDDIRLHVYDMRHLSKEIRNLFKSDMRIIVDYLAEGKNYIPTNQKIIHLEALLLMLGALTNDNRYETIISEMLEKEGWKGDITMCELLDKYENQGMERKTVLDICNLMETMKWTAEQAMWALKIPENDRIKYLEKL